MSDSSQPALLEFPWGKLSNAELVRMMFTGADQLSMAFAQEVVARGRGIIPLLAEVVREPRNWARTDAGRCAAAHATFLLGAIGGEAAIAPLMDALRRAESFEEDMVSFELPSIFSSLGPIALTPLRDLAAAPSDDWMLRHRALSCMAAIALRFPDEEAEVFKFIAAIAEDDREYEDVRAWAGDVLLDFSKAEYKDILLRLVDSGMSKPLYGRRAVQRRLLRPNVANYSRDWMRFYEPGEIADRARLTAGKRLTFPQALDDALSRPWSMDPDSAKSDLGCPHDGPGEPADEILGWWDKPEGTIGRA